MSTRCNVIIKDGDKKLFFYRHSDGYPEGVAPTLNMFMDGLKSDKIRNNISQGAGWLIALGAMEYNTFPNYKASKDEGYGSYAELDSIQPPKDWKVGAYEPTTDIHGGIEYLYIIDLSTKTLKGYESWDDAGNPKGKAIQWPRLKAAKS